MNGPSTLPLQRSRRRPTPPGTCPGTGAWSTRQVRWWPGRPRSAIRRSACPRVLGDLGHPAPAPRSPLDLPGQHVAWETPTFTADLPLVGVPRLVDVKLSSASGEAWFYAKLYDVGPGGDAVLIRRQVSPVRADDLSAPLGVVLPGVSHVMEAGHHLRLVLAATDAAHANRRLPDTTTVTVDPDRAPSSPAPTRRAARFVRRRLKVPEGTRDDAQHSSAAEAGRPLVECLTQPGGAGSRGSDHGPPVARGSPRTRPRRCPGSPHPLADDHHHAAGLGSAQHRRSRPARRHRSQPELLAQQRPLVTLDVEPAGEATGSLAVATGHHLLPPHQPRRVSLDRLVHGDQLGAVGKGCCVAEPVPERHH